MVFSVSLPRFELGTFGPKLGIDCVKPAWVYCPLPLSGRSRRRYGADTADWSHFGPYSLLNVTIEGSVYFPD